ncbi:uncharacterized protein LOC131955273 [Physella acuta]|uniref:uncharacterized protein LOC131955273 n=1 Tax=Physella acuta TaxID=109671 RepID=UPI0027DB044B|nr:uncharacterized protein LOC131955273 [Physella acuta]XP_059175298.1 uncharacterized protein LOC131955273 [Physella acuta]
MATTMTSLLRQRGHPKLIRFDHSQVYFENDRLDADLSYDINSLQRNQYRQFLVRQEEIKELKLLCGLQTQQRNVRPDIQRSMSAGYTSHLQTRRQMTATKHESEFNPAQSFSELTIKKVQSDMNDKQLNEKKLMTVSIPNIDDESETTSVYSSLMDSERDDVMSTAVAPAAHAATGSRPPTVLKKKRAKFVEYPIHWYTTVVPATDVIVKRTPSSSFSRKSASSERPGRPHTSNSRSLDSRGSRKSGRNPSPAPSQGLFSHPTVRPPTKTRRQLLEMAHQASFKTEEDRYSGTLRKLMEVNREDGKRLESKVKDFIRSLTEYKS